jgi:hypothetical protein
VLNSDIERLISDYFDIAGYRLACLPRSVVKSQSASRSWIRSADRHRKPPVSPVRAGLLMILACLAAALPEAGLVHALASTRVIKPDDMILLDFYRIASVSTKHSAKRSSTLFQAYAC